MRPYIPTLALTSLALIGALPTAAAAAPSGDSAIIAAMKSVDPARMRADDEKLVSFGTRNTFSEDQGPNRGVFAARDWIKAQFDEIAATSGGRMRVEIDTFTQPADGNRIVRDVPISNVIATLKGSEDSTRTYVISSHYDSRNSSNSDAVKDAPGADDNASGVIVVLAAARALATMPLKATVIFTAYGAEEQGLKGSAHHAKALKAAGIDVQGDLNNDIVGASLGPKGEKNPHLVRIFSEALPIGADIARINNVGGENDSPSRQLARYAKEIGDGLAKPMTGDLIYRTDRYLRGGDHMSFYAQGFPAIRFVEAVESFAHQHNDVRIENGVQYGDLLQYVDFDYTARVARYNIAVLANLALAPPPPTGVVLLTKDLTNDSDLKWQAAPGASVYEIVARKTSETYWHSAATVTGTSAQLPLSKDNYLFAVRSIDSQGHKSPAAFPTPER